MLAAIAISVYCFFMVCILFRVAILSFIKQTRNGGGKIFVTGRRCDGSTSLTTNFYKKAIRGYEFYVCYFVILEIRSRCTHF